MPSHFEINKIGTFNWFDNNAVNSYNSNPLDSVSNNIYYEQPIQCGGGGYQSDTGQIQLTSDFVPTAGLYDCNNMLVKAIPLIPLDPPILGFDFIGYNGNIDFSDVDPGIYYGKITFTDGDDVIHDWRTTPLNVQIVHDGTQLFEATNFTNKLAFIFVNADLTTIVVNYRVKSFLYLPLAKTDAEDYEDQYDNLTLTDSVPFVTLTQYVGGPDLLPFQVIEKINLLYSLDQVLLDGEAFAKSAKSEFKPTDRTLLPGGAFWTVDIQPNYNYPSEQFITGTPPDGEYIVIKKQITYLNKSANFAVNGIFSARKNLIRIAIVNNGLDVVTILVGNAENDNSYGTLVLPADATDSIDIGRLFKIPSTVWISGIAGADLDITFDYNDYAAANVPAPTPVTLFAKNTLYYFEEIVPGSFAIEFDIATGLGNVGTDHEGCALADGRNGMPNRIGKLVTVWNSLEVLPTATRGTETGSNSINLTIPQLPAHTHTLNRVAQGGHGTVPTQVAADGGNGGPNVSGDVISTTGNGDSIDITNLTVRLPAFYYIGT